MRRYLLHTLAAACCWPLPFPHVRRCLPLCTAWCTIPQHRPIAGATVTLQAADSDFALHATTNADGEFELPQAPIGVYRLTVEADGFANADADHSTVASGTNPVLHIPLEVAGD